MIPRIARQRLLTAALVLTAAGACVDGPFAHANPNDPDAEIVLSIAGGLDTLTSLESAVLFQLVTTPVTDAGSVSWASSAPSLLAPNGLGRFVVLSVHRNQQDGHGDRAPRRAHRRAQRRRPAAPVRTIPMIRFNPGTFAPLLGLLATLSCTSTVAVPDPVTLHIEVVAGGSRPDPASEHLGRHRAHGARRQRRRRARRERPRRVPRHAGWRRGRHRRRLHGRQRHRESDLPGATARAPAHSRCPPRSSAPPQMRE